MNCNLSDTFGFKLGMGFSVSRSRLRDTLPLWIAVYLSAWHFSQLLWLSLSVCLVTVVNLMVPKLRFTLLLVQLLDVLGILLVSIKSLGHLVFILLESKLLLLLKRHVIVMTVIKAFRHQHRTRILLWLHWIPQFFRSWFQIGIVGYWWVVSILFGLLVHFVTWSIGHWGRSVIEFWDGEISWLISLGKFNVFNWLLRLIEFPL